MVLVENCAFFVECYRVLKPPSQKHWKHNMLFGFRMAQASKSLETRSGGPVVLVENCVFLLNVIGF